MYVYTNLSVWRETSAEESLTDTLDVYTVSMLI